MPRERKKRSRGGSAEHDFKKHFKIFIFSLQYAANFGKIVVLCVNEQSL